MTHQLDDVAAEAAGCVRCRLSAGRTQVVFGDGDPNANLMFIGEGPGFHEDKQGVPFVGAAGQLLNRLLSEIGLAREDVRIVNVVMCRPPGNRDPLPDEIEACNPYLQAQIDLVNPMVIVTLGNFATRTILGLAGGITRLRGQRYPVDGRTIIPTFHPAAALRGGGDASPTMRALREDFGLMREVLAEVPEPVSVPSEQLGLF